MAKAGQWPAAETGWRCASRVGESLWSAASGESAIAAQASDRLQALLAFARSHSAFYRERLPASRRGAIRLRDIAPLKKSELMAHFDAIATDPQVTLAAARQFISDPARVGRPFLGRYGIWTSSGTTGSPAVYIHDAEALAVYDALALTRYGAPVGPWGWSDALSFASSGRRIALIAATGGHFAGVCTLERLRASHKWWRDSARVFSVSTPLASLCRELEDFDPAFITSYPTVLRLLATQKAAGRFAARPVGLWSSGEACTRAMRREIEAAFGCRVMDNYAASEFMNIAFQCPKDALHVNADWVVLEPVDEQYRPVPAGVASHTVLLTNLANRVQPLIRYDLGDRITLTGRPCSCGSAFPVMRVEGRRDEVLEITTARGALVPLPPLAVCTELEERAGVHRFQVVQTGDARLAVRVEIPEGEVRKIVLARVRDTLVAYLETQGAKGTAVSVTAGGVEASPGSGKLRQVFRAPGRKPRR